MIFAENDIILNLIPVFVIPVYVYIAALVPAVLLVLYFRAMGLVIIIIWLRHHKWFLGDLPAKP